MKHILIVDGNEDLLQQYEFSFQAVKYNVTTASSGQDGLKKVEQALRSNKPLTIIIVDMQTPGMTGMEFIKAVRQKGIDTPIVAISFSANKKMLVELMRWNCADFCEKPVSFGELYSRIEEAVKRRKIIKNNCITF